jgi:small subunit ribosomal protein S16
MLAIRMQRTGRKGHAQFRMVVQDSRFNPKSGRVVAYVGVYDPHAKTAKLDGEKIGKYLENGARPSDRVVRVLQKEGIKLPSWVSVAQPKERAVRKPEKRRSTSPKPEVAEPSAETSAAEQPTDTEENQVSEPAPETDAENSSESA